ncbi:hypothetical protein [Timonella sp. A28]|uniref:hypothetical protein n=1 Tax=Timonella sp. A28 TaxID=3442640 RepID=UPI003EBFDF81
MKTRSTFWLGGFSICGRNPHSAVLQVNGVHGTGRAASAANSKNMTTAQIFEWSALLTSPFIANAILYFAIPTVSKQFPTTHQLLGWIALALGAIYLITPFVFNLWFALVNLILASIMFWGIWNKSLKKIRHKNETIPVFFFKNPPKYGRNLINAQ